MKEHNHHILGIDRGSKYIGAAYMHEKNLIPMPIGYITNDGMALYTVGDYITRYNVSTIVIGLPMEESDVQHRIKKFIANISYIIDPEKTRIETMNEDFTSVEAGDIVSCFKKNVAEDTVSAMLILDRRNDIHSGIEKI